MDWRVLVGLLVRQIHSGLRYLGKAHPSSDCGCALLLSSIGDHLGVLRQCFRAALAISSDNEALVLAPEPPLHSKPFACSLSFSWALVSHKPPNPRTLANDSRFPCSHLLFAQLPAVWVSADQ